MSDKTPAPAKEPEIADLGDAFPADTAVLEIVKSGSNEGTGWKITIAGPSHPKTLAWSEKSARETIRKQRAMEAAQANGRKWKPEERTPEEARRENVEWVVSRIIDWTPVRIGGDVHHFSEKTAIELLSRQQMGFVFAQIVEFLADERSFTARSATN